jgi:hypothetical protein
MVQWAGLRPGFKAVTRRSSVAKFPTGRERQPRSKTLISISALLSQLPCLGSAVELNPLRNRPRLLRREGLAERGRPMCVQVISVLFLTSALPMLYHAC